MIVDLVMESKWVMQLTVILQSFELMWKWFALYKHFSYPCNDKMFVFIIPWNTLFCLSNKNQPNSMWTRSATFCKWCHTQIAWFNNVNNMEILQSIVMILWVEEFHKHLWCLGLGLGFTNQHKLIHSPHISLNVKLLR